MDEIAAIDHALNAAFTIYHLLEWKEKTKNPDSKKGARNIANGADGNFQILHDIVTCNKHVRVDREFHSKTPCVYYNDKVNYLTTEDGIHLFTENGENLITEDSKIVVNFDNEPARNILESAIKEFH